MLVVHGSIQLALVLDIYLGNGNTLTRSEEWLQADATLAMVIVMGVFLLFDLVSLSLIGQLLLFHLKLQKQGLTTYQFIVQDSQKKREQNKKDRELQHEREVAMAKAKEEGRTLDAFKLQFGGNLRNTCGLTCCDPLGGPEEEKESMNGNSNGAMNGNGVGQHEESKEPEDP